MAGLHLDPWQAWFMEQSCAVKDETFFNEYTGEWQRKWAAFEVGLMVSRQNGKGSILEARELAGLFLLGERTVVHSAHMFDTSKEHFLRILDLIEGVPDFDREIDKVTRSHGDEGILLKSGQRLRFRTRTKGGGRGWSPDFIALDEAMYLGPDQIGALMPAVSARPNPQIWYTGSAGDKESTQFGRVRNRAIHGVKAAGSGVRVPDPRLFYAEWSIDACNSFCLPGCEDHDRPDEVESYGKANPGLGIRITVEHIESERRSMPEEVFLQERLGVGDWPVDGDQWGVIDEQSWNARADENSEIESAIKVIAVDTSPNREFTAIVACGANQNGELHVEITMDEVRQDHRPGADWVVKRVKQIWDRAKPDAVVIDKTNPSSAYIEELESLGVTVLTPTTAEYAGACGMFVSGVQPRKGETADIVHLNQISLNSAVAGATKRKIQDKWGWDKANSAADISPLVAATNAVWGYRKVLFEKSKAATPWVFQDDD